MENTFTIDVDIKKTSYFNEPTVTSNDDITFVVNISDDGQTFDLADVTTVSLANTKPDKEVVVTPGVISGLNQVTFNLGTNETAVSGSVSAVVQLYDANGRVSTLSFSYAVKVDPTGSGYVPSTDEQTLIEVVLNDGPLRIQEAIDAGVYANLQGDYALAQGDIAATESANLSTLKTDVQTATTNANTQGDFALAQGTYAKTEADRLVGTDVSTLDFRVTDNTAQLADIAINPDNYIGTDIEKVQQAFNDAITQKSAMRFSRVYDITGGSIVINKPTNDRTILYLLGFGGGIKKDDAGYIYTTANSYVGDIISHNMKYRSISNAGTKAWNGKGVGGIIRFSSVSDSYVDVDTIVDGVGSYVQSVRFLSGTTITGGKGWAFEWDRSFDTTIDNCVIEHREHGIRNTIMNANPDNNTLRITNNVIEGLTGKGTELGSSFAVTIQGNYMENNAGGYFDLSNSLDHHNGLSIIGNSVQQNQTQKDTDVPAFKIGRMGNYGVHSSGNVAMGVLYELISAGTNGRLVSSSDISYNQKKVIGSTTLISELGLLLKPTNGVSYGLIKRFNKSVTSSVIASGATADIEIDFTDTTTVSTADIISIVHARGSGNQNFIIMNFYTLPTINKIIIRVKNESVGGQTITLYVNVLKIE